QPVRTMLRSLWPSFLNKFSVTASDCVVDFLTSSQGAGERGAKMNSGILICFLGTLSFGLLGCASKAAERRNCQASALVVMLFGWATLVMLIRSAGLPSPWSLPLKAVAVSVACGICSALAYYAFQYSIGFGKVAVGWLMMNISSAIPAIVSLFVYGEKLTRLKVLAFCLVLVSLYFIFRGRQAETQAETSPTPGE